jgi:predicted enzyme related to lactoylglutathione lyase
MPCPVVHFEIGCRDREQSASFYSNLFDWQMTPGDMATQIQTDPGNPVTGHIVALGHEPFHYTNFYVEVSDLAAYLAKAAALGGSTLIPPIPLPNGDSFAWLSDPDGNTVGLLQRAKP